MIAFRCKQNGILKCNKNLRYHGKSRNENISFSLFQKYFLRAEATGSRKVYKNSLTDMHFFFLILR